jgi:hypothetical protein
MAYPERGATYKHKPKFIERMKRAEGGATTDYSDLPPDIAKQLSNAESNPAAGRALDQELGVEPAVQPASPIAKPFGSNPHGSIDAQGKVHGMKRGGHKK